MFKSTVLLLLIGFNSIVLIMNAQPAQPDSAQLDIGLILSKSVNGDVPAALDILKASNGKLLSEKDQAFKTGFENRFADETVSPAVADNTALDELIALYTNYWKKALLNPSKNYDTLLLESLRTFVLNKFPELSSTVPNDDTVSVYMVKWIKSKGYHTLDAVSKTGGIYDLMIWKDEVDTTYSIDLNDEKISVRVVLMDEFVTLGWTEFATMDKYHPGGWATDDALYCVKKAYDVTSETFLISYLAHEGRHFSDYKKFPKLKNSADLEYRAKLTELSMADTTLYQLIGFFISTAEKQSKNGHSVANYYAIHDLSLLLFGKEFESDLEKWKNTDAKKINKAAQKALQANTRKLKKAGSKTVEQFIDRQ